MFWGPILFEKSNTYVNMLWLGGQASKHVPKPGPGWGPGRVGAHMGPYGPLWAHMGLPGQVLEVLEDYVRFPSTFRRDIWTNFAGFGSKTKFFMKFLDDSASFLLEKLKNQVILTTNLNILPKIPKTLKKSLKICKNKVS